MDHIIHKKKSKKMLDAEHKKQKPLTLEVFRERRKPIPNTNLLFKEKLSNIDKFAVWITQKVGTMGFFLVVAIWTILWLGWNMLAPEELQFDKPMGFVFWLFISNLLQILLMPLIMVGQNIQGRHSELRAEHDLEINVKAEQEIEVVIHHLEYQNDILIAMVKKMGIKLDKTLSRLEPKRVYLRDNE